MLGDSPVHPVLLSMDLAQTRESYHDKLGLEILSDTPEAIEFRCGGQTKLVVTKSTTGTAGQSDPDRMGGREPPSRARSASRAWRDDRGVRPARAEDGERGRGHGICVDRLDRGSRQERSGHYPAQDVNALRQSSRHIGQTGWRYPTVDHSCPAQQPAGKSSGWRPIVRVRSGTTLRCTDVGSRSLEACCRTPSPSP
jgi:catechol 2,3-dioxygenase-like lactoylglutathione lyase family enzyme